MEQGNIVLRNGLALMLVLWLGACAHPPISPAAGDIEAAYKVSYLPPTGYARVYIFPVNHVVLGRDHLKVTDVYLGKHPQVSEVYRDNDRVFVTQIKENEFGAFDIRPGQFHLIVQWHNVKIIDQTVMAVAGMTLFIKPDWDKRPDSGVSPLMAFGAVGGAIAALAAGHDSGTYDVVDPASAMPQIQTLQLSSVTSEAHVYVQQQVN